MREVFLSAISFDLNFWSMLPTAALYIVFSMKIPNPQNLSRPCFSDKYADCMGNILEGKPIV